MIFRPLTQFTTQHAAQLQDIMDNSFELAERWPVDDLIDSAENNRIILLAALESDRIIGFAALYHLAGSGDIYLPYLAFDKALRGAGHGSRFFQYMVVHLQASSSAACLVWEVKKTATPDPSDIDNRRIRFYEKLGSQRVQFVPDYRVPMGTTPIRYHIFWIPLQGQQNTIGRNTAIQWIHDIYALYYPEDGSLRDQIIAEIPDSI